MYMNFVTIFVLVAIDFTNGHKETQDPNSRQWLQGKGKSNVVERKRRQTVIRNNQPGRGPQVQGIDLSPSVVIYYEDEKDINSLLTNKTIDAIINSAENNMRQNIQSNSNSNNQYYTIPIPMVNQQQNIYSQPTSYVQKPYNNVPTRDNTETIFVYDQPTSYARPQNLLTSNRDASNTFPIEITDIFKYPQEDTGFKSALTPGTTQNYNNERNRLNPTNTVSPQYTNRALSQSNSRNQGLNIDTSRHEIPLSISSNNDDQIRTTAINTQNSLKDNTRPGINNKQPVNDSLNSDIDRRPADYETRSSNSDRLTPDNNKQQLDYDRSPNNDRRPSDFDGRPSDDERRPSDFSRRPPDGDRHPNDYERRPSDYDRRPSDYDRRPVDYDRRPPDYDRRPNYDGWRGGDWDRRPPYGRGPPHRGWGGPPYGRGPPNNRGGPYGRGGPPHGRGSSNGKQPPYVINLNFDQRATFPNGTLKNENATLTDNQNNQDQNPDIYETLKTIFNPKPDVTLSNNDNEKSEVKKAQETATVKGLFQVTPITPEP